MSESLSRFGNKFSNTPLTKQLRSLQGFLGEYIPTSGKSSQFEIKVSGLRGKEVDMNNHTSSISSSVKEKNMSKTKMSLLGKFGSTIKVIAAKSNVAQQKLRLAGACAGLLDGYNKASKQLSEYLGKLSRKFSNASLRRRIRSRKDLSVDVVVRSRHDSSNTQANLVANLIVRSLSCGSQARAQACLVDIAKIDYVVFFEYSDKRQLIQP
ncbi:MAG: hypothetical protein LBJ03_03810 [Holosporales bacterium]|nr:hypothetical protein [Holosporales bacterium]